MMQHGYMPSLLLSGAPDMGMPHNPMPWLDEPIAPGVANDKSQTNNGAAAFGSNVGQGELGVPPGRGTAL